MKKSILIFIAWLAMGCSTKHETQFAKEESWALTNFIKVDSLNPILSPSSQPQFTCPITKQILQWEKRNVLNPSAIVRNDTVYLFYRAQDKSGTSRIGMATSVDGLHFLKMPEPVIYPDHDSMKKYEWNYQKEDGSPIQEDCVSCYFDGVEDPRIIADGTGSYFMTYTAYDGKTARLSLASSTDLKTWTKHGLVLKDTLYENTWSKSGAIVVEKVGDKIQAKKINEKYWMYFGDTNLFMATSDDLINWEILESAENQKMVEVLHPRAGYFDSRLVEPGPFALMRDQGILLIYNGSNAANFNDTSIPKFTYSAGQALFDKTQPYKMLHRLETNFIHPDKDYEKVGEVDEVCFVEGLVYFNSKWFLYYGTADSKIAVAVREGK